MGAGHNSRFSSTKHNKKYSCTSELSIGLFRHLLNVYSMYMISNNYSTSMVKSSTLIIYSPVIANLINVNIF